MGKEVPDPGAVHSCVQDVLSCSFGVPATARGVEGLGEQSPSDRAVALQQSVSTTVPASKDLS